MSMLENNSLGVRNNLDTYGPILWNLIHKFSFCKFKPYYIFICTLKTLIPCPICKHHYQENMNIVPILYYKKQNNLFYWSYLIHDRVNILNNKQSPNFKTLKYTYKYNLKNSNLLLNEILFMLFTFAPYVKTSIDFQAFVTSLYDMFPSSKESKLFKNALIEYPLIVKNNLKINNIDNNIENYFNWVYRIYYYIKYKENKSVYRYGRLKQYFVP